jgi:hypothetical protein
MIKTHYTGLACWNETILAITPRRVRGLTYTTRSTTSILTFALSTWYHTTQESNGQRSFLLGGEPDKEADITLGHLVSCCTSGAQSWVLKIKPVRVD